MSEIKSRDLKLFREQVEELYVKDLIDEEYYINLLYAADELIKYIGTAESILDNVNLDELE